MKFPPRNALFLSLLLGSALAAAPLGAAPPSPEAANDAALALMNDGKLAEAAAAFEDILKKYPTFAFVPDVQYRLASVDCQLGRFDQARGLLDKITRPPAPADIIELGFALLPQTLAAQAGAEKDPNARAAGYENAVREYDAFLRKYPASAQAETILYGRALVFYQTGDYGRASEALRSLLTRFPNSETSRESHLLLALSETARAARLATDGDPKAAAAFDEAERLLAEIAAQADDPALANDARLRLGDLYATRALFAPEAARAALCEQSLRAYRSLTPRETALAAQKARLHGLQERRLAALAAQNAAELKALDAAVAHAAAKLAALNAKGDLSLTALLKTGQLYLQQGAYDEARLVFREMQPFARSDEEKKTLLHGLAVSYARQLPGLPPEQRAALLPKAAASYDAFQRAYPGDPVAEVLPCLMGNLYLPSDPQTALHYYEEETRLYPHGPVAAETRLGQARALAALKAFDKALALYRDFLKTNPKRELAAEARFRTAEILRETTQTTEALAEYSAVAAQYNGLPQAEAAAFWIAKLHLDQGAAGQAIPEWNAFLAAYPTSAQCPAAKYCLAKAYLQKNDPAAAARLFKEVIDAYPASQAAQAAYFDRAALAPEAREALLREFLRRYPDSTQVYRAYHLLAQDMLAAQKPAEALALYQEMALRHPGDPQAAFALFNAAALWAQQTEILGPFEALSDPLRAQWRETVAHSLAAAEQLITRYPESPQFASALQYLLLNQKRLAAAKLASNAEIAAYFQRLAAKFTARAPLRGKILFTLAAFTSEEDPALALQQMRAAYDPRIVYAPADLDLYATALANAGAFDEAAAVIRKLAADFPDPDPAHPEKSSPQTQQAQATALFGQAKLLQSQGRTAEAAAKFETYKLLYPNLSPAKALEASYAIAEAAHDAGQNDKADPLLTQIFRAPAAGAALRANAMLLHAKIREEKKELGPAIDENLKIATLFEAAPEAAAEALWRGAQLLERQAALLPKSGPDPKTANRPAQLQRALKAYRELAAKYGGSPHAAEAKERIAALEAALD